MPLALLALAISAFGIGTTEFVIMGLLPQVAGDLSVSIPTAGLLISGYALGVTVGGPVLTAATVRLPRKYVLIGLLGLFIAGNLLSAVAPSYGVLMAGRVAAALSHGAFFGVGSVVAAGLVPPHRKAGAIALMFTGVTVANVLGAPMGTLLGQHLGWRSTFVAVTLLGLVAMAGVAALVPGGPAPSGGGLRGELAAFRRPQVWLALGMTALGYSGLFGSFAYVAPMMTEVAGFSAGSVTWLLVLFGVGLVVGNLAGGRLADRWLMPTIFVLLSALAAVLALFTLTAHSQVGAAITLVVLGAVGFGSVPPLQLHIMRQAGDAPALASAANIGAFNLGNAIGPFLGGLAIDAGLGYTSPNWVGAIATTSGIAVAVVAAVLLRRSRTAPAAGAPLAVAEQTHA